LMEGLGALDRTEFLDHAVSGPGLVAAADLVVGGGGTMNREGAVLGIPVWSVFTGPRDRKSTRLNSSHVSSSYAVFCLKKKRQRAGCVRPRTRRPGDREALRLRLLRHAGHAHAGEDRDLVARGFHGTRVSADALARGPRDRPRLLARSVLEHVAPPVRPERPHRRCAARARVAGIRYLSALSRARATGSDTLSLHDALPI